MNQFHAIGHIATDPIRRETTKGILTTFRLAAGAKNHTQLWIDIETWGHQAGTIYTHGTKGRAIAIAGQLTQKTWRDRTTGNKRSRYVITATTARLLAMTIDTTQGFGPPNNIHLIGQVRRSEATGGSGASSSPVVVGLASSSDGAKFDVPLLAWGAQGTGLRHLESNQVVAISGRLGFCRRPGHQGALAAYVQRIDVSADPAGRTRR